jgi:hypothetical protein
VDSSPDRVKLEIMKFVFVAFPPSIKERERAKTGWLGIRIMCPSGATCLSADCCFSEPALKNPTRRVQSGPHHLIEN